MTLASFISTVPSTSLRHSALTMLCLVALVVAGVSGADHPKQLTLEFLSGRDLADTSIGFHEPSGLSVSSDGGFWLVSDGSSHMFRLDAQGKVRRIAQPPLYKDLEGIVEDPARNRLLAVKEDNTEVIVMESGEVRRIPLLNLRNAERLSTYFPKGSNDGLEGITVEPATGTVFVIKERAPRLLIELSPALDAVRRVVVLTAGLGFAAEGVKDVDLDVSGLVWDPARNGLWIVSDTGSAVYFFRAKDMHATGWHLLDERGGKSVPVENAEGAALSVQGDTLHIVTDDRENSRFLTYGISETQEPGAHRVTQ